MLVCMESTPGKRTAKIRLTLTKRSVEALAPAGKFWIAWDDKLTGFGKSDLIFVSCITVSY